ncbi:hypothetical protein LJR220_002684 [Bradyrhizobium sp. LjRoot220]|uniref:hypothetical protein n=1 Tax=Bradyrhizobium sp. LjRoot220 TaxID=3342284 RepID=UPI003ECD5909
MPSGENNDGGFQAHGSREGRPECLAITSKTLTPLDAREREMLMVRLNKLR